LTSTADTWLLPAADDFCGQERVRNLLDGYLRKRRLTGTVLLLGQRGLGKTTLATVLARALVCERNADEPRLEFCGECYACRSIAQGEQPEYTVVRPRGQDISVKQVEEEFDGFHSALLHPALLSHRVFIIDDAHHLNETTGNQMLKLFEEAPSRTVFILVTDKPELLLPTIHSRGQKLTLAPVAQSVLCPAVRRATGLNNAIAAESARMSAGRYVDAVALAGADDWRSAVRRLAGALLAGRGTVNAANDLAAYEFALLWTKLLADTRLSEEAAEKKLSRPQTEADKGLKTRRNELTRQALTTAYDRGTWWLLAQQAPGAALSPALWDLKQQINANVDPLLAQTAFELALQ
jgi:DNA polymerase III delta prime subunit